jgi:hypothetical protein
MNFRSSSPATILAGFVAMAIIAVLCIAAYTTNPRHNAQHRSVPSLVR